MQSKENQVMELFFDSPKHWHFEEIRKKIRISKSRLAEWLKRFEKEGTIKKIKQKEKMPYYTQVFENRTYQQKKRIFALKKLTDSRLWNHLTSLPKTKVVILFGSFSRYDWHTGSDIDLFIYGDITGLKLHKFEQILHREIQVHNAKDKKDLKKIEKMLPFIIQGDFIKGSIQEMDVDIHART